MTYKDRIIQKKYQCEYYSKNKNKLKKCHAKWRFNNKDKVRMYKERDLASGMNTIYGKKYRLKHKEYHKKRKQLYVRRMKKILVAGYGGKCECCGEKNLEFLALDHRYGDGAKDRKENKRRGTSLHKYVIDLGFPRRYRILCHNCNMALGFYGYCPHKRRKKWIVK